MTRVKICGIQSLEDALACVSAGADAIGMLVDVKISPRCISAAKAKTIVAGLPPFVTPVIVMMPSSAEEVAEAGRIVRPGAIQLHGEESPEMLRQIKSRLPWVRLIKTIHVGSGGEIEKAKAYEGCADAILLDTLSPSYGGTGKVHDWAMSAEIIKAAGNARAAGGRAVTVQRGGSSQQSTTVCGRCVQRSGERPPPERHAESKRIHCPG